jgi:hypothetical protein
MISILAGFTGGVVSWFVTEFIAHPFRRFFQMKSEIYQCVLFYGNVHAPIDERGKPSEKFTDDDKTRLREAQSKLRQLAMEMQSFAATEYFAARLVVALGYHPMKAGRSLVGYSNSIAVYGDERVQHRENVFAALQLDADQGGSTTVML